MLNLQGMLKAPTRHEKRALTMRERRNQRWKEMFDKFGGSATCAQLATVCSYTPVSINAVLYRMRAEDPPLVEMIGRAKRAGGFSGGRAPIVYKWIGE